MNVPDGAVPRIKEAYKVDGVLPTDSELKNMIIADSKKYIKHKVIDYEHNKARDEAILEQESFNI